MSENQLVNSETWLVPLKSHWSTWKMLSLLAHTEPTSQTTLASAYPLGPHSGNTWTSLDYMSFCWPTRTPLVHSDPTVVYLDNVAFAGPLRPHWSSQTPLWFTQIMLAFAGPFGPYWSTGTTMNFAGPLRPQ